MNPLSIALPSPGDTSVGILQQITGMVDYFITGNSSQIVTSTFAQMLQHFNEALLGFGLLIFAILLFVGTMNTAADGQFLGRNWNSVWTPVRIIFGVLFVVPLKTGLCFGQYVFLYLILVGVNIGTYVWNEVIDDVFNHYSIPAVPSYVANYGVAALENGVVLAAVNQISSVVFNTTANSGNVIVPLTENYSVANKDLPGYVLSMLNQAEGQICASLYTLPEIQSVCQQDITNVLNGSAVNNQSQPVGSAPLDGSITVAVGGGGAAITPAIPTTVQIPANGGWTQDNLNSDWNNLLAILPSPSNGTWDGKINVWGYESYGFSNSSSSSSSTSSSSSSSTSSADSNFAQSLQNTITTFVAQNILPVSGQPTCPPDDNSSCSLAADASIIVANAQNSIEQYSQGDTLNPVTCTLLPTPNLNPTVIPRECHFNHLNNYNIVGMNGNTIQVPLKGSWWNAGDSYLILDNHFSQTIKALIQAIQNSTAALVGGSFTGNIVVQTNMLVQEQGTEFQKAITGAGWEETAYMNNAVVGQTPTVNSFTGLQSSNLPVSMYGIGSEMQFEQPIQIQSSNLDFSNLNISQNSWQNYIEAYMPATAIPPVDLTTNTIGNGSSLAKWIVPATLFPSTDAQLLFYNDLAAVPAPLQAPLSVLFIEAENNSGSCDGSISYNGISMDDNGNCYVAIYPYVQNILNLFAANGLLSNTQDNLPVSEAMNEMFSKLLGPNATNNPAQMISSVMQDVYNLAVPTSDGIFSSQFSMIQQIRNAGISMIVACIESMQDVYTNYENEVNQMLSTVNEDTSGAMAQAAIGTAWTGVGFFTAAAGGAVLPIGGSKVATMFNALAGAASLTSQILQAQIELNIAKATITTITNLGLQMMWLPVFLFVIVSLFTAGVQFSLVIPFMPYIMFWAGQMAWVIGVIEALVAAPLVMLAFAHPGGNDYVGHAAPAVRFLIGVIFRPVLMVIGMITGILLTYVLINYSAEGFHIIADGIFSSLPQSNVVLMGSLSCLLLFTYASFLVMAFVKCFSPIYVLPEKVVQWINGHAERAGEQESQQFSSNAQQTAQSGAQAGGQSLQQGAQAQQSRGQQMSDLKGKEFGVQMTQASKSTEFTSGEAESAIEYRKGIEGGKNG